MSDQVVRDLVGYQTSRDYGALWDAAQEGSIVCTVDHGRCRDVGHTIATKYGVNVGARGICYTDGETREEFAKDCALVNLEWLPVKSEDDQARRDEGFDDLRAVGRHVSECLKTGREVDGHYVATRIEEALRVIEIEAGVRRAIDPEAVNESLRRHVAAAPAEVGGRWFADAVIGGPTEETGEMLWPIYNPSDSEDWLDAGESKKEAETILKEMQRTGWTRSSGRAGVAR